MKLTQTNIGRLCVLASGERDKIFFDDEVLGFGLRVRKGGSRKWVIHYRQGGLQRRHTIGPASVLTVDEARIKARKVLVAVDDGKDPAAEKIARRAAAGLIFSSVMKDYLAVRQQTMKPRSHEESTRHLKRAWKAIHGLALTSVTRPVVAARLRDISSSSGPVAADRARSTLSAMFAWAIGEGLCDTNPVVGTNKASEDKPRERVLNDAELTAVWKAAPDNDYGRIVRLLMLTGQRRLEIGELRWPEIEGEGESALIALPSRRTKNSRQHDVPLSPAARRILGACIKRNAREFVFGDGKGGYSGWSKSKAALDEAAKIAPWVLHDLRRTTATRMADLGVQPHVIEAILNHVSGHKAGVAGIYNRSSYATEKRAALNLWAEHIERIAANAE
jgi:integrase